MERTHSKPLNGVLLLLHGRAHGLGSLVRHHTLLVIRLSVHECLTKRGPLVVLVRTAHFLPLMSFLSLRLALAQQALRRHFKPLSRSFFTSYLQTHEPHRSASLASWRVLVPPSCHAWPFPCLPPHWVRASWQLYGVNLRLDMGSYCGVGGSTKCHCLDFGNCRIPA